MKSRATLAILTVLMACGAVTHAPSTGIEGDPALAAKIDAIAAELMHEQSIPGMSIAVARDGKVVFAKGYGFADVEHRIPATASTVYRIGSVTKQFTASAVMQLVQQGKLSLDDELTKFLPDYPTQGKHITVRELLTHTAGVYNYTDEHYDAAKRVSAGDLVAYFSAKPLSFEPGSDWSYSNSNYFLLGLIVEKLGGHRYADYLAANVFARAALHDTAYCPDEPRDARDAHGYATHDGKDVPSSPVSMTTPFAAGALCSTALDLVAWTDALHAMKVVDATSLTAMTTPAQLSTGKTVPYGFGLAMGELSGHRQIMHGGGINGFMSDVAYFPDDHVAIAVLVNTELNVAGVALERVARAALGVPEPKTLDLPLSEVEAHPYLGKYEIKGWPTLEVTMDEGKLVITGPDGPTRLLFQGHGVFVAESSANFTITFVDEGLILKLSGMEFPARKL